MISLTFLKDNGFNEISHERGNIVFCYNRQDASIGCFLVANEEQTSYIPYIGIFADIDLSVITNCPCTIITNEQELTDFLQWLSCTFPKGI